MKFKTLQLIASADPDLASDLLKDFPAPKRLRYAKRLGDPGVFLSACSGHHAATLAREAQEFGLPLLGIVLGLATHSITKAREVGLALGLGTKLLEGIRENGSLHLVAPKLGNGAPQKAFPLDDLFPQKVTAADDWSLPCGLHVPGDLELVGWDGFSLPGGMRIDGNVTLRSLPNLTDTPDDLSVGGDITIDGCASFQTIGALRPYLHEGHGHSNRAMTLTISNCPSFTSFSPGFQAHRMDLMLLRLQALDTLPALEVHGLHVEDCPALASLQDVATTGEVVLFGCESLRSLPSTWKHLDALSISRCNGIAAIPKSLVSITGDLILSGKIRVPATLAVHGKLSLE